MRRGIWIGALLLGTVAAWGVAQRAEAPVAPRATVPASARDAVPLPAFLPGEAREVLARIEAGGPFAHRQDGSVFENREGLLPRQPRGYYREYTVETPGSRDRGARRIVSGGDPPTEFFYTADHYRSFRRFTAGNQ